MRGKPLEHGFDLCALFFDIRVVAATDSQVTVPPQSFERGCLRSAPGKDRVMERREVPQIRLYVHEALVREQLLCRASY